MVGFTLVTLLARHSLSAETLTIVHIAGTVECTNWITVTGLTTLKQMNDNKHKECIKSLSTRDHIQLSRLSLPATAS